MKRSHPKISICFWRYIRLFIFWAVCKNRLLLVFIANWKLSSLRTLPLLHHSLCRMDHPNLNVIQEAKIAPGKITIRTKKAKAMQKVKTKRNPRANYLLNLCFGCFLTFQSVQTNAVLQIHAVYAFIILHKPKIVQTLPQKIQEITKMYWKEINTPKKYQKVPTSAKKKGKFSFEKARLSNNHTFCFSRSWWCWWGSWWCRSGCWWCCRWWSW